MPSTDPFDHIHALLKTRRYRRVLTLMLDENRLQGRYRQDANHAWYVIGDTFFKMGSFQLAARAFRNALRSRPKDAEACHALGNVYSELSRPTLAERYFRKALRLDRGSAALRYNLANALFDQGKYESAVRLYRRVGPNHPSAHRMAQVNLATAQAKLQQRAARERKEKSSKV